MNQPKPVYNGIDGAQDAWFRLMVEQLPAAAWTTDTELRLILGIGSALATLEVDPKTTAGLSLYEFFQTDDPDYLPIAAHLRALAGNSVSYEHCWQGRVFHSHVEPLHSEDGTIVGCIGVALDITERKQAELKLTENEERLRLLTDALPIGIAYVDEDDRFQFNNKTYEKWFRIRREDLAGMHVSDVIGKDAYQRSLPYNRAALRGERVTYERSIATGDGVERDNHVTLMPDVDDQGNVRGYYVMVDDITDRKRAHQELERRVEERTIELQRANTQLRSDVAERQRTEKALRESEERLRQIAESIGDVFWLSRGDLNQIEYVSPAFETIWGVPCDLLYTHPEAWMIAIHPDERDRTRRMYYESVLTGDFVAEYRIVRPDGGVRWIRDRGFPIHDESGEVVRVAGVAVDITDAKLAEQALREGEEALRRNERLVSIGTLAAGIAHEINNPLGAIVTAVDAARRSKDQPQGASVLEESLELIKAQALRCSHIVKRVLRFSRQQRSPKWPSSLLEVARRALDFTRWLSDERHVPVLLELPPTLPDLKMNPTEIEQAMVNLISNSIEASQSGSPVQVRIEQNDPASVRIVVCDEGLGMTDDQISRIFDPFYTTRPAEGGTGLGLSITHSIVGEHHGTIDVQSKSGEGTNVTVTLPLNQVDDGHDLTAF